MSARPLRCVVVPPAPVPYREPLFAALAARPDLELRVIYQAGREPGWDQRADWFPQRHAYEAEALRAWRRRRPGRTPIVWPRGLERALARRPPDCVVAWEYGPAALRALAWGRRHRRPVVTFTETTQAVAATFGRAQRRVHRWGVGRSAGFIAASSAARDRLVALGAPLEGIAVSLQSADLAPLRAVAERRARGTRGDGPVRVLFVGRLVPDKNVAALIEALACAELPAGTVELEVCGGGPLEGELRALADRFAAPVRFRGAVAPAELPDAYARADVLALPSRFEPFGVAAREAAAAGLPIVCSRVAGAAGDVAVEGRNALLVDPTRTDEIAAALGRLVRDAELRAALGCGSRAIDAEHPLEADVTAFAGAVRRAVGRSEGRDR